jgi:hypothetical protein
MKRLFLVLFLLAGSLIATNANAQVYVRGRVGFGFPHPHAFYAPFRPAIICPPVPVPYYGGGVVVDGPVYGYGYRHYAPYYHEHRVFRGRRW